MTDHEVRYELVTLLFAGHETTATSLAWAFDLLLHHPEALDRLVTDLEEGGTEYLDATITETLRGQAGGRDRGWARTPASLDRDHTIPAGATACPNIYLAQRRPDLYEDPLRSVRTGSSASRPRRPGGFRSAAASGDAWGASFAASEMRIVIPEVLQAVTLRPGSPRPARIHREAVTFVPHDGARCVVTARTGGYQ